MDEFNLFNDKKYFKNPSVLEEEDEDKREEEVPAAQSSVIVVSSETDKDANEIQEITAREMKRQIKQKELLKAQLLSQQYQNSQVGHANQNSSTQPDNGQSREEIHNLSNQVQQLKDLVLQLTSQLNS